MSVKVPFYDCVITTPQKHDTDHATLALSNLVIILPYVSKL